MSLERERLLGGPGCFPRVSGDEPVKDDAGQGLGVFSPRERG